MLLNYSEVLLLLMVTGIFITGVIAVYRSAKHTAGEKLYWYILIFILNVLGVAAFFFEYYLLKKNKV